jgi:hypothetical protein
MRKLTPKNLPKNLAVMMGAAVLVAVACTTNGSVVQPMATSSGGEILSAGRGKPSGRPPALDRSIASVPLDEILFDTFQGGAIALSAASDSDIDRLRDAIVPIYEPRYEGPEGGDWLDDDDVVLGYQSESGAYAYPVKMLNLHEIVNDVIDGVPILISYCPLCASGVVYSRLLSGRELVFGNTSALYESDLVMFDWETGSYWHQVIGEAIVGPLTGERLVMLPSRMVTWSDWKALHPDSRVLSKDLGLLRGGLFGGNPCERDPFVGYDERVNSGGFAFPVSPDKLDDRLLPGVSVLAVEVDGVHVAFSIPTDRRSLINGTVSGRAIVVFTEPTARGGAAFFADVDGRTLTFEIGDDGCAGRNGAGAGALAHQLLVLGGRCDTRYRPAHPLSIVKSGPIRAGASPRRIP